MISGSGRLALKATAAVATYPPKLARLQADLAARKDCQRFCCDILRCKMDVCL